MIPKAPEEKSWGSLHALVWGRAVLLLFFLQDVIASCDSLAVTVCSPPKY